MKAILLLIISVLPALGWRDLFNGKDLNGWDTYLAKGGLNNDPKGIFTIVETDGKPAIRVSGEIYGAITTHEEFTNFHIRVDFKWGGKRTIDRKSVV